MGLTEDEAYVLLRSTAMREKKKIGEIAQSILTAVGDTEMTGPLRIGFIPLCDAAALIVAVDKGFTAAEGLDSPCCGKCRGRMSATSSISACSTRRTSWHPSRLHRASGSDTSRCRIAAPFKSRPQRQCDHGSRRCCMRPSWPRYQEIRSIRWRPRWRSRASLQNGAGAAPSP